MCQSYVLSCSDAVMVTHLLQCPLCSHDSHWWLQGGATPGPHLAGPPTPPVAPLSELEIAEQTAKVIALLQDGLRWSQTIQPGCCAVLVQLHSM